MSSPLNIIIHNRCVWVNGFYKIFSFIWLGDEYGAKNVNRAHNNPCRRQKNYKLT